MLKKKNTYLHKKHSAISLFLIIMLASAVCLCACGDNKLGYNKEKINASIIEQTKILSENFDSENRATSLYIYMKKWGDDNNFVAEKDKYGNIFISRNAFTGKNDKESTDIMLCKISDYEYFYNLHSLACALNILQNSNPEDDIKLIVTVDEENNLDPYEKIPNAKLICRKIIALSNDPLLPENNLILSAPGVQNYDMYLPVNFEGAQFEKAYKIEIAGLSEGTSENRSKITHPNPIKTLNTLLATCRNKGILYQLASFEGAGAEGEHYPTFANATIIINGNNEHQFIKQFSKLQKKFVDKNDDYHPNLTYTVTEVPIPEHVISMDSSEKIVSFLYTMINGKFLSNDETENEKKRANSEILYAGIESDTFRVHVKALSFSESIFHEFDETFSSICRLTDFTFEKGKNYPAWYADTENNEYADLEEVIKLVTGSKSTAKTMIQPQGIAQLKEKDRNLNIAILNMSKEKPYFAYEIVNEYFKL